MTTTSSQMNFSFQEGKINLNEWLIKLKTVNNYIMDKLNKKGFEALRILGKNLRQVSSYNGYNKINKDQFLAVLRDMDILLPKANSEVF